MQQLFRHMPAGCNGPCLSADDNWLYTDAYMPSMQSEYAPSSMERRHFISRFTGSAGTAVITTDAAALWTDGRYFLQARELLCRRMDLQQKEFLQPVSLYVMPRRLSSWRCGRHAHLHCVMLQVVFTCVKFIVMMYVQAGEQLGPDWTLMKAGTEGCPEIPRWLASDLAEPGRVGIDPYLHTVSPVPSQKVLDAILWILDSIGISVQSIFLFILQSLWSLTH